MGGMPCVQTSHETAVLTVCGAACCACRDVNEAPIINATLTRSVTENSAVGLTLTSLGAVDQDANAVLTYVAAYPPEALGLFLIDSMNGTIVITGPIDFERKQSYSLQVRFERRRMRCGVVVMHKCIGAVAVCR